MGGPGPYSGKSSFALVARVTAFTVGIAYGSMKLTYLRAKKSLQKTPPSNGHH